MPGREIWQSLHRGPLVVFATRWLTSWPPGVADPPQAARSGVVGVASALARPAGVRHGSFMYTEGSGKKKTAAKNDANGVVEG